MKRGETASYRTQNKTVQSPTNFDHSAVKINNNRNMCALLVSYSFRDSINKNFETSVNV